MSSPTSVPTASRILPAFPSSGVREANGNSVEQEIRRYETPLNRIDGQAELLEDGDSEKDGIVVIPAYNVWTDQPGRRVKVWDFKLEVGLHPTRYLRSMRFTWTSRCPSMSTAA